MDRNSYPLGKSPGCSGQGFAGYIQEDTTKLLFDSCSEGDLHEVHLWAIGGVELANLQFDVGTSAFAYSISGIALGSGLSAQEESAIEAVLTSPEAGVATILPGELIAVGMDPESGPMVTLFAALIGFETNIPQYDPVNCATCTSPPNCVGCCGLGCVGCIVCSQPCQDHDQCVAEQGHAACLQDLAPAGQSMVQCWFSKGLAPGCCPGSNP